MSLIALPSGFAPKGCRLDLSVADRVSASPFGGSEQVVDMLNDRWLLSVDLPAMSHANAAPVEAFLQALRQRSNTCRLYHFARRVPRGTARGTLTLGAAAAQGAASITVAGVSPATGTLLAGDLLGLGGLLLMVATDCTAAAGVITVPLVNRLRSAQLFGAGVTWSQPAATFRRVSVGGLDYVAATSKPITLDFAEAL